MTALLAKDADMETWRYDYYAGDELSLVACDEGCGAKRIPETPEELLAAYEHWKYHGEMYGCSHGC